MMFFAHPAQFCGGGKGIIDAFQQCVFQCDHATAFFPVFICCLHDFRDRIAEFRRDNAAPGFLIYCVERNGQRKFFFHFCQFPDARNDAAGGYGDPPGGHAEAFRRGQLSKGVRQCVKIQHAFPDPHKNNVVRQFPQSAYCKEKFLYDFPAGKVAYQPMCPAGAEGTADRTAHLGTQAEGGSPIIAGDQHQFHMVAVLQSDQQFFRAVRGRRNGFHYAGWCSKIFFQIQPELSGNVAHFSRIPHMFAVHPVGDLHGPEFLKPFGFDIIAQFLDGHARKQFFHGLTFCSSLRNTPFQRQMR